MTAELFDFDLHGVVGIRLLDASSRDADAVARQLGPISAQLTREPDIVIRFVDRLSLSSPLRLLGLDDTAFTDDAFLILRSKYKARVRVQIPIQQIGQRCEIVCERGAPAVPLLIAIINLTALGKGVLPLHAGAFIYNNTGVMTTGWSKGGKTETLLAFMAHGATYVGDEWIYIHRDGQRVFGIPEPVRVWDWHIKSMPAYRRVLGTRKRMQMHALNAMMRGVDRAASSRNYSVVSRTARRAAPLLKNQLCIDVPPTRLFGEANCAMKGTLDKIFYVASHQAPDLTIQSIPPEEIAERMLFSLQEEQMGLMSTYWKFRFAFPGATNELIENSRALQRDLLLNALAGKESYAVYHPYPVSLNAMYEAIRPYCSS